MVWLFVIMLMLFVIGTPIAWSMALAAAVYMTLGPGVPLQGLVQRMVGGIDNFPLLAVPFFLLAGNLMNTGGITDRLVGFARALVGHVKGGLAHAVIVTNMIMAGMSGSVVADAAGSGMVLIPAMKKAGYEGPFAAAIVSAAATMGPIIPPSIPFVIYASIANTSVGRLFLAGAVPGIVMGVVLMIFAYVIARRRGYPADPRISWGALGRAALGAVLPLGLPVIILGGILAGIMTPTEAAAAGAAYAFCLGFFVYHELKLADMAHILVETGIGTSAVLIIISAAQPMGWVLTFEQASAGLVSLLAGNLAIWQILLLINIAVLILGCFMDGLAIMMMLIPILLPLLQQLQIDLVHFGVFFTINIMIGTVTPPVGVGMYIVCSLGKVTMAEFAREAWPFIIALTIALFLVTYLPGLSLWLPGVLMPTR
jgi:tripartite ATP-independent transporter DctM subunit